MNKDRGTIKWNALMLPEHVKLLREWQAEDHQIHKPELDSWQIEEVNERLQTAISQNQTVTATIWYENELKTISSKIARYNQANKKLFFSTGEIIFIHDLINIELELLE